jgi:thiol:disulfide interchange protein DsbC
MIYRILKSGLAALLLVVAPAGLAGEALTEAQMGKLRTNLEKPNVGLKVVSAQTTGVAGLVEVQLSDGPIIYATLEGDYFILGDLYSVGPEGYVNLADQRRAAQRVERLAELKREDMIIFSPEKEPRSYITVFFDDTCFYCQKLHQEVAALNENGVEVRYLAYPRAGLSSDAYKNLASAWCADDPNATLVKLINKQSVPIDVCEDNPVAAQFQLGQELGVRGTPAIVTDKGQMIPGYQSADELMVTLGLN